MLDGRASSGVIGLDAVLCGGWPAGRMYLIQGFPGTGKTTLGFQFVLDAVSRGQRALYITLSETRDEVLAVTSSHGWTLEGLDLFELDAAESVLGLGDAQTMFHPSDVEFRETSRAILAEVERVRPARVVLDSLSELALLARDPLAFRRELLMLKRALMTMDATVLLLSDRTNPDADRQVHSLAHGVLHMEELSPEYGPGHRRLRVTKLRGSTYGGGYHDFTIQRGGLEVYPRLIAAEHGSLHAGDLPPLTSGIQELDLMLGDGLVRGASTLFMGPAGTGKSSLVSLFAYACVEAGDAAALFLFDEEIESFLRRSEALGMSLRPHVASGLLSIRQVDPGQLSPGRFIHCVREAVEQRQARFVAIDSLNGYTYAMSNERYLAVQLHELLSYLAKRQVSTALVLTQSGLIGATTSPADITYIADAVVLTRFFEAGGEVRRAISILKKRGGAHEATIRELRFGDRVEVGAALSGFQGVLTGVPAFIGDQTSLLAGTDSDDER